MDVGALIRRSREEAGLSQRELAQRAGTSQPAVAKIESGITSPTVKTLERLMEASGQRAALAAEPIDTGVDLTQIAAGLRMTPDQRLAANTGFARGVMEMRREQDS
ncbi:MAG: helix-turn-helix transcriptional regulator [Solirubrobacterales bacterium]